MWYCAASLDWNGWHCAAPAVARRTHARSSLPHGVRCDPACSTQHDALADPPTHSAAVSARRVHRRQARACGDRRLLAQYSFVGAMLQQHAPAADVTHSCRGEECRAAIAAGSITTIYNNKNMTTRCEAEQAELCVDAHSSCDSRERRTCFARSPLHCGGEADGPDISVIKTQ